jgi:hypothetical protein
MPTVSASLSRGMTIDTSISLLARGRSISPSAGTEKRCSWIFGSDEAGMRKKKELALTIS